MSTPDNNTVVELRSHFFEQLRTLSKATPGDELKGALDKAKGMAELGQVLINSMKVEVDYLRVTGAAGSTFFPDPQPALPDRATGATIEQRPGVTITRHICK